MAEVKIKHIAGHVLPYGITREKSRKDPVLPDYAQNIQFKEVTTANIIIRDIPTYPVPRPPPDQLGATFTPDIYKHQRVLICTKKDDNKSYYGTIASTRTIMVQGEVATKALVNVEGRAITKSKEFSIEDLLEPRYDRYLIAQQYTDTAKGPKYPSRNGCS